MNYDFIKVALAMIVCDVVSGVLSAFITGTFQSSKMRQGGLHKLGLLFVICFGLVLDWSQSLIELGFHIPCNETICGYIALMEILSVVENINVAFPTALPKALTKMLYSAASEHGVDTKED